MSLSALLFGQNPGEEVVDLFRNYVAVGLTAS
jgi:hypothetical protein